MAHCACTVSPVLPVDDSRHYSAQQSTLTVDTDELYTRPVECIMHVNKRQGSRRNVLTSTQSTNFLHLFFQIILFSTRGRSIQPLSAYGCFFTRATLC